MNNFTQTLFYFVLAMLGLMALTLFQSADASEVGEKLKVELREEVDALLDQVEKEDVRGTASEEKAPKPFEDSDIKRELKDGKVQKFDGNKYMIVRRGAKKKKPVTKTITVVKKQPRKKNRLTLYVGSDPNDLETNSTNDKVILDKDGLWGVGYTRNLNETIHLDAVILTNETVMGGIGVSF